MNRSGLMHNLRLHFQTLTAMVLVVPTLIGVIERESYAGGRSNRRERSAMEAPVPPHVVRSRDRAPSPPPKSYDSSRYPKFIGGFHSRELQNVGVPPGDVGLRGNGFSMFPW